MGKVGYYETLLAKHGPTYAAVDCGSEESHAIRLRKLANILPLWGCDVLDVGCGHGSLLNYAQGLWKERYLGIDCSPEMIKAAKKAHKGYRFEVGDIRHLPDWAFQAWRADYVLASGLFQFSTLDEMQQILGIMFRLAKRGVAANFLRAGNKEEGVVHPLLILQYALLLTPYVSLSASYLPNDFTIYLYKEPQ